MVRDINVRTSSRVELVDITSEVERVVRDSGLEDGVCYVFVPHTTAGVTINENADPSVRATFANLQMGWAALPGRLRAAGRGGFHPYGEPNICRVHPDCRTGFDR